MQDLLNRADHRCELCEAPTDLAAFGVAPHDDGALAHTILTLSLIHISEPTRPY